MKLLEGAPRFLQAGHSSQASMRDMLLVLMAVSVLPVVYHGPRAAVLIIGSMVVCILSYIIVQLVTSRTIWITDCSPFITGAIIALLMPANVPYWVVVAADLFAILVAKEPFGGTGRTPFNPAAAGMVFVSVLWPQHVFTYYTMNSGQTLPLMGGELATSPSPAGWMRQGIQPEIMPFEMIWGRFEGPMGATAAAAIGAGFLYLVIRKSADWRAPVFFVVAAACYAALFPRILTGTEISVKYELLSGSLLFCACFMAADPCTTPRTSVGKCIYGALAGILLMVLRNYGAYEQGGCFAILLMGAVSPLLDRVVLYFKRGGTIDAKKILPSRPKR